MLTIFKAVPGHHPGMEYILYPYESGGMVPGLGVIQGKVIITSPCGPQETLCLSRDRVLGLLGNTGKSIVMYLGVYFMLLAALSFR